MIQVTHSLSPSLPLSCHLHARIRLTSHSISNSLDVASNQCIICYLSNINDTLFIDNNKFLLFQASLLFEMPLSPSLSITGYRTVAFILVCCTRGNVSFHINRPSFTSTPLAQLVHLCVSVYAHIRVHTMSLYFVSWSKTLPPTFLPSSHS